MTDSEIIDPSANAAPASIEQDGPERRASFCSQNSQTAKEFIESQMRLEADAREVLPYSFDSCTQALGPLRQILFACLTCNPPSHPDAQFTAAGVCYSCSIACHGEHTLVELFNKRNFVCDCGTTRIPAASPCTLRNDPKTGTKGVHSQEPHPGNRYNSNFQNKFCGCGEDYDAHQEKGTMFQCLGLGTIETGGCGEDWWHPECLIGLPRNWYKNSKKNIGEQNKLVDGRAKEEEEDDDDDETPLPPGFPAEEDFETFLCYKCVESNAWLKRYAGSPGFLAPVFREGGLKKTTKEHTVVKSETPIINTDEQPNPKKRKAEDDNEKSESSPKRTKEANQNTLLEPKAEQESPESSKYKHDSLPSVEPEGTFSLFLKEDFRDHFCRCPECYPNLARHNQLREEEDTYEPPLSEDGDGRGSTGTGSLLDRGEAALSNIDRVRAIEGAMVYNHLRDKVKEFLKPFAESGTAVGADDIKAYFEKLRGDEQHIKDAAGKASASSKPANDDNDDGDNRREQSGV